jgi:galactokinase
MIDDAAHVDSATETIMGNAAAKGEWIELFVPGRLCVMGEHSDWAGGFRRLNPALDEGFCIVCGTEQGLFARVRRHPSAVVIRSTDEAGRAFETQLPLNPTALRAEAAKGSFFSYAAGVAYQLLTLHNVQGVEIDNYRTTLPLRKGLSSSAAFCVLAARAFNQLYGLKYSARGEMELAYKGETTTPSQCGRMDQCCAFGPIPVLMTFDGDFVDCQVLTLPPGTALHFVVVDLGAAKDTPQILAALAQAFPFGAAVEKDPKLHAVHANVRQFLGPENRRLLAAATAAFLKGDAPTIGALMNEYQSLFDSNLQPACPQQLASPVLHAALAHKSLQHQVWGGKGVGSQGDGSLQFLCKGAKEQAEVARLVEAELGMVAMPMTIAG